MLAVVNLRVGLVSDRCLLSKILRSRSLGFPLFKELTFVGHGGSVVLLLKVNRDVLP